MKTIKKIAVLFLSLWSIVFCLQLTGCKGTNQEETQGKVFDIAVCYTAVQNFPSIDASVYEAYIDDANEHQATVSVIALSGDPACIARCQCGSSDGSQIRRQKAYESIKDELLEAFGKAADTSELDILSGLDEAARSLPDGGTVIVISNGISTAGTVKAADLLYSDLDAAVRYFSAKGMLPDLSKVSVKWLGLGQTADAQEKPSIAVRTQLKELWTAIIEAAGATVSFDDTPLLEAEDADRAEFPDVSEVAFQAETYIADNKLVLTDAQLAFLPDSAEFADQDQASSALGIIVAALQEDSSLKVQIIGETPSYPWDAAYSLDLSSARANAIKDWLVKEDIDEERIEAVGIGDTGHDRSDIDEATGLQIPEMASKYRRCTITLLS